MAAATREGSATRKTRRDGLGYLLRNGMEREKSAAQRGNSLSSAPVSKLSAPTPTSRGRTRLASSTGNDNFSQKATTPHSHASYPPSTPSPDRVEISRDEPKELGLGKKSAGLSMGADAMQDPMPLGKCERVKRGGLPRHVLTRKLKKSDGRAHPSTREAGRDT
ncbi:uncharacterized protein LY79DRAFT_566525 [Colletotrichum navitas]|uniref:Uncharacterized protein n=1 Tax=Colletotrichum navitas TaxID=681940 RepID=A0AAD8UYV5_9PEZI|nr:uncharacterized protein LY79DRAFT_566525 [Colletotrichum navitas]KAK1574256.1 hypothetical protein LY79DRAFT_566525 [Colletotrichum navitas]